jgi:site-specific DNA-methyltransferase (adenine-specific)
LVKLSNDLTIKLLGVKEDESVNGKANEFLQTKTKGKRVFLKYDTVKYDSKNNLLCYLYLENKTSLNAHLIKNGLAKVDETIEFKYKEKFVKLLQQENG